VKIAPGLAIVRMTVRPEMVNGFGTSHGGIVYSLADSALAFATNASGFLSVAIDCSLSYPKAVRPGDVLTATAVEQSTANRLGFCGVDVMDQTGAFVGHFRGTVYRTQKAHFPEGDEQSGDGGSDQDHSHGQRGHQRPSNQQSNNE
jgi:acyl-CoA thioesterase